MITLEPFLLTLISAIAHLEVHPNALAVGAALLGLIVGSFLNVIIYRLPKMMEQEWRTQCAELLGQQVQEADSSARLTLAYPPSHCPHCRHRITWLENIPLISYLWQGGKCAACGMPISPRYPLVELISGLLAGAVVWHYDLGWQALGALVLTWALITLSAIDAEHQLLPDAITLPLLWLGLGFNLFGVYADLQSSVVGAMVGYLSLWTAYVLFKAVTGKEGMGYGDFKLLAMLGAWTGWQGLPVIIVLSSFLGAIIGTGLIMFRSKGRHYPIPFGPYLACAGWVTLLWGNSITDTYIQWIAGP